MPTEPLMRKHLQQFQQCVMQRVFTPSPVCMQLMKMAARVGVHLNAARANRGLKARAVRACVVGFPNVGKSALINRLLGRRLADSAAKPGVTRSLRWMRVGGQLDLLDAPGTASLPVP